QTGLHSYGFDTRLADGCFNFWVSQMLILALGLIPARFWASAVRRAPVAASAAPAPVPVPPVSQNAPTTGTPQPHANGNGHANGKANGQPRRDKGKHGKRR
ncbi:MAG: hypothetical protein J0I06_09745, partial [Planctomycetes bacterium]|nr:hypothetical protein [Planctomycetota bacterium]